VIQNLVINAVQAMPDGGAVTIAAANRNFSGGATGLPQLPSGRYVEISVSDTGLGIAREHLGKIFDPYFTTKAENGTGLGLAIVARLVQANRGFIHVKTKLGQGTEFAVYLPIKT
jgi:signal transduction histidine kinase